MKSTLISTGLVAILVIYAAVYLDAAPLSLYRTVQVETRPVLDVPYVPTPHEVVATMLDIAAVDSRDILYDLGCGDGRIVVAAAKNHKVRRAVGIDIDPQRIMESNENARRAGVTRQVAFHQKDLFEVDIREASVVSLYLLPSVNLKLRPKLFRDLKPGTRIVSHDFDMGDWKPDKQIPVGSHTVYYWVLPASVNGTWTWSVPDRERQHRYELRLSQHFQAVDKAELKVDDATEAVTNVKLSGNELNFDTEGQTRGETAPLHFSGIVQGDSIQGTFSSGKKASSKNTWNAERDPSTAAPVDNSSAQQL